MYILTNVDNAALFLPDSFLQCDTERPSHVCQPLPATECCCVQLCTVVYCCVLLCTAVYCCVLTALHVLSADSAIPSFVLLNQSDLSRSSCRIHTLQAGHQDTWAKSSLNQWVSTSRLSLFSIRTKSFMLVGCQLLALTQLHLT